MEKEETMTKDVNRDQTEQNKTRKHDAKKKTSTLKSNGYRLWTTMWKRRH